MLRLKKLVIHRYRGIPAGTTLEFSDGINAILGQNGTGKTTLLNLIVMILRSDFSPLKGEKEGADFEYVTWNVEPEGRTETFEARMRLVVEPRTESLSSTESQLGGMSGTLEQAQPAWSTEGTFAIVGRDTPRPLRFGIASTGEMRLDPKLTDNAAGVPKDVTPFDGRGMTALIAVSWIDRSELASMPSVTRKTLGFWSLAPFVRQVRFDEGLGFYRVLTGGQDDDWSSPSGWMQSNPRRHELRGSLVPREVALEVNVTRTLNPALAGIDVSASGTSRYHLLQAIVLTLGLQSLRAQPRLIEQRSDGDAVYQGWDLHVTWPDGTTHHHSALSFGQKRMLTFLWHLGCIPDGPVIADELVNGFHHAWITRAVEEIGERQAFIASQNPLLLDFLSFEKPDDVRRSFVLCSHLPPEQGPRAWTWRNPTPDEADSFFRAYSVGFQHVSEILRTKGLW